MTRRVITGFSNPTVKALRALRDKKHRRRSGRFLAEGLRLLTDARECGHVPEVLVLADRRDPHPLLAALEGGPKDAATLTREIYTDVDPKLLPAAERNVLASLIGLADQGRVGTRGEIAVGSVFSLA